jgi:hypothetical protein
MPLVFKAHAALAPARFATTNLTIDTTDQADAKVIKNLVELLRPNRPLLFGFLDLLTHSAKFLAQRLQILGPPSSFLCALVERNLISDSHPAQLQSLH